MAKKQPANYFLNESHQLTPNERSGGANDPKLGSIPWQRKARTISAAIKNVRSVVNSSQDPLKEVHCFALVVPVSTIEKRSTDLRKAPGGTYQEKVEFDGTHGRIFERLGLDLLQVTDSGAALVHAPPEKFEQLETRVATLHDLGVREQARWVAIESFEESPASLRMDESWIDSIAPAKPTDVVFEIQPSLSRSEAEILARYLEKLLTTRGEKLSANGSDFSGRVWVRGQASPDSLRLIAKGVYSIQSIHEPFYSEACGKHKNTLKLPANVTPVVPVNSSTLPCVAVVDMGIPASHVQLAPYRRGQYYSNSAASSHVGDHGSCVASRVVFGDHDDHHQLLASQGTCCFYDAIVANPRIVSGGERINDKAVLEALHGVNASAPDVRVFNLSFGHRLAINAMTGVERRESLSILQDLDNFAFASDAIVVVAAGNSEKGITPDTNYPDHHIDPRWGLGPWACGFNTWVCGSYCPKSTGVGFRTEEGWPSPFSRVGPGISSAPIPSFSARGGNWSENYMPLSGLGVWTFSARGLPEDRAGTSFSAPIVSREAAIALKDLQTACAAGSRPFAVAVRAFLSLTARPSVRNDAIAILASRTLGYGRPDATRVLQPQKGIAVILWQGCIESNMDTLRVQLPVPLEWLDKAQNPKMRLIVCYDSPVNASSPKIWACRKVRPVLKASPDGPALRAPRSIASNYPVIDRIYPLTKYKPGGERPALSDFWLLHLEYDQIAPYPAATDFDPRQRVAFAAELFDDYQMPVDPQPALQALPLVGSMNRLSQALSPIRAPIVVRH